MSLSRPQSSGFRTNPRCVMFSLYQTVQIKSTSLIFVPTVFGAALKADVLPGSTPTPASLPNSVTRESGHSYGALKYPLHRGYRCRPGGLAHHTGIRWIGSLDYWPATLCTLGAGISGGWVLPDGNAGRCACQFLMGWTSSQLTQ